MFGSQASTAGSAISPGSQVDGTPASQFSPVSPQYFPASLPSQPESVSGRRPHEEQGDYFFCVRPAGLRGGLFYFVFSFRRVFSSKKSLDSSFTAQEEHAARSMLQSVMQPLLSNIDFCHQLQPPLESLSDLRSVYAENSAPMYAVMVQNA